MEVLIQPKPQPRDKRQCLRGTLLAVALVWSGAALGAEAQTRYLELHVEAAFLYNFAKFAEWPADTTALRSGPVTFCVLGSEPLHSALEESLAGKSINGRPLVSREIESPQEALACQIVFIGWEDKKRVREALDALDRAAVLTVADSDSFARRGGMIQLIRQGNKFRFAVNVDAVNRHGLRISSKLLQLAEVVRDISPNGDHP